MFKRSLNDVYGEITSGIKSFPLQAPPPGVVPNFVDPESRAWQIHVTAAVCILLLIILASLRVYAKLVLTKAGTMDDYSFILGFAATISYIALTVALVDMSPVYGVHAWNVKIGNFTTSLMRSSIVYEVVYGPFIWLVKLSLFLLYLNVFGPLRWMRHLVFFGVTVTGLFYLSTMIVLILLCAPRHGTSQMDYLAAISSAKCRQNQPLNIAIGCFNIASDFFLLLLPLPAIRNLRLPPKKKLGVMAIFLTGLIACISSILGLVYRIRVNEGDDNSWKLVPVYIVTMVEFTAGNLVACMPSVAAVMRQLRHRWSSFFITYGKRLQNSTSHQRAPPVFWKKESSSDEGFSLELRDTVDYPGRLGTSKPSTLDFKTSDV